VKAGDEECHPMKLTVIEQDNTAYRHTQTPRKNIEEMRGDLERKAA